MMSESRDISPNRLLGSLLLPAFLPPFMGWVFSVALPVIRDEFELTDDVASWLVVSSSLMFIVSVTLYGRLSDGLGRRRLLLVGMSISVVGTLMLTVANSVGMVLLGRIIQSFGVAAIVPLCLALISEAFPPEERGAALGTWSTMGPVSGVVAPLVAGIVLDRFGWRMTFVPAVIISVIGVVSVYVLIPSRKRAIDPSYLRTFDWVGFGLLGASLTSFMFYLSSRALTGVPPLRDWRFFIAFVLFFTGFMVYERRHTAPFIQLSLFNNSTFTAGAITAGLRMFLLSGIIGFLFPLFLRDVFAMGGQQSSYFLMTVTLSMTLVVRWGGGISDRFGSRSLVMACFGVTGVVLLLLSGVSADTSSTYIIFILAIYGFGLGPMLAAIHHAALSDMTNDDLGAASGVYNMIRFLGSTLGAAVGGILLQTFKDNPDLSTTVAYQRTFLWFALFAVVGMVISLKLPKKSDV